MVYDIFVYCTPKCGGSTLAKTFCYNGYKTIHVHDKETRGFFIDTNIKHIQPLKYDNIFRTISNSSFKNQVYIIDSYRTPIERKISYYFQHLQRLIPNFQQLSWRKPKNRSRRGSSQSQLWQLSIPEIRIKLKVEQPLLGNGT
jgi:hypothetical protein